MSRFEFQAVSVMGEFGDQGLAFVKGGGLKPLFKCLMGKGKWGVKRDKRERGVVAVLWGLLKHTPQGEERKRLLAKVAEGDGVEAIVEIAVKWDLRGRGKEKEYLASEEADADEEDGKDVEAEARARAIAEGLDTFWYACDVLWRAAEESATIREKCGEALRVRGGGWSWLTDGRKEMGGNEGK